MRPRHKAAENPRASMYPWKVNRASMRPRHKAAENDLREMMSWQLDLASMRPRHKAAENLVYCGTPTEDAPGFNEAAT